MIKAIFLDFDGTIYSHNSHSIPSSAIFALNEVRKKGVKVFLCSGRCPSELKNFDTTQITFDGYVYVNGQLAIDLDDKIIFSKPITGKLKETLVNIFKDKKIPTCLASLDEFYLNYQDNYVKDCFKSISSPLPIIKEFDGKDIFCATCFIKDKNILKEIMKINEFGNVAVWGNGGVDIVEKNISKATGIKEIAKKYHFNKDELMGIGDGENDISMIEYCGIGVAMGNSMENTKKAANYITSDIDNDGIYNALKYYNLI